MKTLITCHANADCDAFAAMLAARHLYEAPALFFPGTQEAPLAKIFSSLDKDKYNFVTAQEIKWDEYDRLVLVDTRQASRLNHISPLLQREDVCIEIWDHHPDSADDIKSGQSHIEKTGSCTTILCQALQQRGVSISGDEATLLGLGIYGDTGSFTYSSTKREDFIAAGWLLSQGMDVTKVNDMSCHELTKLHVQILNALMESAHTYTISGIPILIAEVNMNNYIGDFAHIVHKLMEIEKAPVLFVMGIMGDKIQLVARSHQDVVNVGEICSELGGGGHVYAASASIKSKTVTEIREIILRLISRQINPEKLARDYMSSPPIGVSLTTNINDADELMLHFGLKAVPVFQEGSKICIGLLDAQTAARANAHGLGAEPVGEYMQRRIATLPPGATIRELAQVIVAERQRLVPIVEDDEVVGVVTRTDLINVFANESGTLGITHIQGGKPKNVAKLIRERLPQETQRILQLAGRLGKELAMPVYAVGGFVRDLLLNYPNHDIDLVAEIDGMALAHALARELGGRVRTHEKFMTSVVIYHDDAGAERHIDVATARLEYYEYPAALPTVELSSIKMDLFRRDFSINALAVRLDCEPFGQLEDYFGGRRDIKDQLIRVLHTLSFVEDPTRCIRAVRFEQRYKFRIGPGTEKLIKNILPMHLLEKLSPHRIFNEFKHLCEEETAAECFLRLSDLGILTALAPKLSLSPTKITLLKNLARVLAWHKLLFFEEPAQKWISFFLALCHNLNYAETSEIYNRFGLPQGKKAEIMRQRETLRSVRQPLLQWQQQEEKGKAKISQFCAYVQDISLEVLLYFMAEMSEVSLKRSISRYITHWRNEKADIDGNDLRRIGIPPGPKYSQLLKLALNAKLDGKAPNAKRQLAIIINLLKKERDNGHSLLAPTPLDV